MVKERHIVTLDKTEVLVNGIIYKNIGTLLVSLMNYDNSCI